MVLALPTFVAALSFLQVRATGTLVTARPAPASIAPFAEHRASQASLGSPPTGELAYVVVKTGTLVDLESVTR